MKLEELKKHQIFQIVEQIKNRLSQEDASKISIEERDFINEVFNYFEASINNCYPSLTMKLGLLNQIQNYFSSASAEINNFFANNNYGHINNAINNLNTCINTINQIPQIVPKETDLSGIILNFKSSVAQSLNEINKQINETNNKIGQSNEKVTNIQQNLTNQQTQINQLVVNFQNEFNQIKKRADKEIEDIKDNSTQKTNELIKELKDKLEDARKIVNVIGNIGVAGDYQKNAEHHRKQANLWRWIAIAFMFFSIIYLGYSVLTISQYEWHISLLRIIATTIFIYPVQYAASQSGKHREQELYNKKMELDLSAINPFIELFDDKKKQEIKEKLVDKYFNNNLVSNEKQSEIPITIYEKIVNQLISVIKSVK